MRVLMRQDVDANWAASNPILARGEFGLNLTNGLEKVGDGVSGWNALPYRDRTAGLPRVLAAGGAWQCSIEASSTTGVITMKAVGPSPATTVHTLTWNPATGAMTADGLPVLTQSALDNTLVIGPVLLS